MDWFWGMGRKEERKLGEEHFPTALVLQGEREKSSQHFDRESWGKYRHTGWAGTDGLQSASWRELPKSWDKASNSVYFASRFCSSDHFLQQEDSPGPFGGECFPLSPGYCGSLLYTATHRHAFKPVSASAMRPSALSSFAFTAPEAGTTPGT